jgi:3-oxoacyl-[acyl-carrier-protein] synthase-3
MIKYNHVRFQSFGYVLPENVVTSVELERELSPVYERFGVHEGRLEMMTGIRERRFWDEGTLPSDGATRAGLLAMEASGVAADEIECLIHTAVSRDFLEPATASVVHDNLRLSPKAFVYDISNACLGFLNGILSLGNMIELGQVKRGLVVAGESSRNLVHTTIKQLLNSKTLTRQEFKAAFASLTIGSGAVGLVLSHDSVSPTDHRLLGGAVMTATEHNHLCRGSADTGFSDEAAMSMQTHAEDLLVNGCALAAETWAACKKTLGWSNGDVDRCFGHQVGATHRDRMLEALELDPSKDLTTFDTLGNVGAVSLPMTMAMGLERDPPPAGERIAMLGIGSGLSSVMLGARW